LTQTDNGRVEVLLADEFEGPDFNEMINKALELMHNCNVNKVNTDAANPAKITRLKQAIGEHEDYEKRRLHT
jgi:ribosomal protein L23